MNAPQVDQDICQEVLTVSLCVCCAVFSCSWLSTLQHIKLSDDLSAGYSRGAYQLAGLVKDCFSFSASRYAMLCGRNWPSCMLVSLKYAAATVGIAAFCTQASLLSKQLQMSTFAWMQGPLLVPAHGVSMFYYDYLC